jgi:tripartite-type tricarboxylate transporter receptor subunit TctC
MKSGGATSDAPPLPARGERERGRRAFLTGCASLTALATLRVPAFAQAPYPTHPVRIVVPFTPGGGADILARLMAPHLQRALGQSFYVENRAGAAGRIGTGVVAKAEPDGATLLVTTESSLVIAPHASAAIGYDPLKDFAPISLLTRNPIVLVVHPSVPATTLQDYIALARAKPGEMFFASSGVGGPNHLAGEMFNRSAGIRVTHVPFPGTGAAIPAVISNQVGAMWGFLAGLIPHIRSGALRALAVGSRTRADVLPEVPTVAEAGVAGFEAVSWIGLLAPAGTPTDALARLSEAAHAALQDATVRQTLIGGGSEIVADGAAEFQRVIADDYARYAGLKDVFRAEK